MKAMPFNSGINEAASIINQRVAANKTANSAKQNTVLTAAKKLVKTNLNQVNDPQYNSSYFKKNMTLTPGMSILDMSDSQKIAFGVGKQMERAEVFMDVLQRAANYADLEMKYEKLVSEGDADAKTQAINERALAFYREMGSANSMEDFIWLNNVLDDFSKLFDKLTDGAVSKATNYIKDDISSLEYLGLANLDQMSAAERKDALINAMDIVRARINQTPWKTNQSYTPATEQWLDELDARHYDSYARTVTVVENLDEVIYIGSAAIGDILEGKSTFRPDVLPEVGGVTMSYYEWMKSMGVNVTGRVDMKV